MRKRWFCEVQWFKRRWPIFSIGFTNGEFILQLWVFELSIWRI